MNSLAFTIKSKGSMRGGKKLVVEMDPDRLERLAANFGMLNPDFLKSLDRSERDYRMGRVRKIHSLQELIK